MDIYACGKGSIGVNTDNSEIAYAPRRGSYDSSLSEDNYDNKNSNFKDKKYKEDSNLYLFCQPPKGKKPVRITRRNGLISRICKCANALVENSDSKSGIELEKSIRRARGLGPHDLLIDR